MADTVLLLPPPGDPHGLLRDSVGGGRVPVFARCLAEGIEGVWVDTGWGPYFHPEHGHRDHQSALVLQHRGVPDPIGMARAREVLARVEGCDPAGGVIWRPIYEDDTVAGWCLETASGQRRHYWPSADAGGPPERTIHILAGLTRNKDGPLALAHVLAARAGCEVVVIPGGGP